MKKYLCLLLVTALILSVFTACGEPETDTPNDSTGGQTSVQPTEGGSDGGDTDETAKVGDVLEAPEKTVSMDDLEELTFTTSSSSENSVNTTYAVSNNDGDIRFYEKVFVPMSQDTIEYIGLPSEEGTLCYTRYAASGNYALQDLSAAFESNDGFFRFSLARFGIDYQDWYKAQGFTKCEDAKVLDRDCFVYEVTLTCDMYEGENEAVISVDKETGLWLKMEVQTEEGAGCITVDSIENSAAVIPGPQPVELSEQVIYDDNGVVITAKALDHSDPNGVVLVLETKNSTGSDVKFTSHYFDINGLCIGGSVLSDTCPAGETKETRLTLPPSSLDLCEIDIIQTVETALKLENVHTEASPDGDYTVTDGVLVETTGALTITTECPADYVQPVNKEGTVLIDTDDIYLVLCGFWVDESGQGFLKAYCENRLDEPIRTTLNIKTINGIAYDDFDKINMQENSEGFDCFTIWPSTLADMGITQIESVELTHEVFSGESFVGSQRVTEESELIRIVFE